MDILNLITTHPIASLLAVAIPIRIYWRDIKRAKNAMQVKSGWDGIERRSPNRAKNVVRPQFGERAEPTFVVEHEKTGTDE